MKKQLLIFSILLISFASISQNTNEDFIWKVTIPVNTTATMFVPASDVNVVFENNKPVTESETIQFVRSEKEQVILKFGSGTYLFTIKKLKFEVL